MAIRPRREPNATPVLSAKGRGRPVGLRVGLLRLAVGRFRRCARRALPPRPAGTRAAGGPSRRAASPSRRSLSPVRETRVTAASGGHARPAQEDVWTSPKAFQAAVALFGDGPSRRMDGQRVPRGVGAAALASAWNRQTEALRRAVRDAHGYVLEDAMPVLARAMSVAADSAAAFDLFTQEVERLRQVAAVPPSPVRFDAGDIRGRRHSRDDEDEEESPRNMHRRSSSVDGGSRGHFRN